MPKQNIFQVYDKIDPLEYGIAYHRTFAIIAKIVTAKEEF